MNFIILGSHNEKYKSRRMGFANFIALFMVCVLVCGLLLAYGFVKWSGSRQVSLLSDTQNAWRKELQIQKQQIDAARGHVDEKMQALSLRVAEIQAQMIKLDALGERLIDAAKLNTAPLDDSDKTAKGGPEEIAKLSEHFPQADVMSALDELSLQVKDREQQLAILEEMLSKNNFKDNVLFSDSPVQEGWLSSHFGYRVDPFTGRVAWHRGVDFSGKKNSPVLALASGLVTWSGKREGYGNLVEINHGDGYVTRYGHNNVNLVKVGDMVTKGQQIALMGDTGRATGYHVHLEVFSNGKAVNPTRYIGRQERG